jgi:hypothetical protein
MHIGRIKARSRAGVGEPGGHSVGVRKNLEVTRSRPRRSAQSLMAYLADREPPPTNGTWKDAPGPLIETDGRGSSRKMLFCA